MVNDADVYGWVKGRMRAGSPRGVHYTLIDAEFGAGTADRLAASGVLVWRNPARPNRVRLGVLPKPEAPKPEPLF